MRAPSPATLAPAPTRGPGIVPVRDGQLGVRPQVRTTSVSGKSGIAAEVILDAEIVSALRGLSRPNATLRASVPAALRHLAGFPIRRMQLAPLLQRIWSCATTSQLTTRRTLPWPNGWTAA